MRYNGWTEIPLITIRHETTRHGLSLVLVNDHTGLVVFRDAATSHALYPHDTLTYPIAAAAVWQ